MDSPEMRDEITNRALRRDILNHLNFENWYITLSPRVRDLFHAVMEEDVTPELILAVQEIPDEERRGFTFVQALGNGNPSPSVKLDLTSVVLSVIMSEVEMFGNNHRAK